MGLAQDSLALGEDGLVDILPQALEDGLGPFDPRLDIVDELVTGLGYGYFYA